MNGWQEMIDHSCDSSTQIRFGGCLTSNEIAKSAWFYLHVSSDAG